ncbi:S1C family serine protease [Halobacteriaceae archaeon GCM10025711]
MYEANESRALVVTNWHVVERSLGGDVQFSDGQWRRIDELVGVDFFSDLAVLSVEDPPGNVSALPVASDRLDQGEEVVAFGSPLGLEGSITRGIVSAVNRSLAVQNRTIADAVQIDTPISPGSSGGPLVDCGGDVVGVNFAGVAGEDVNFAISSAMVRQVVPAIVENGTYNHSYLGVRGVTLSPTMARVNGLNRSQGVLVVSTVAGAPASIVLRGAPRLSA